MKRICCLFMILSLFMISACSDYFYEDIEENGIRLKVLTGDLEMESGNTNLGSLSVSSGILYPEFDPDVTEYAIGVDSVTTTLNIDITTEDIESNICLDYEVYGSSYKYVIENLEWGVLEKKITVIANDNTHMDYNIKIYKNDPVWESDCIVDQLYVGQLLGRTEINGTLKITNTDYTNLDMFLYLGKVKGDLIISHNSKLNNISGIRNIELLYGDLIIEDNEQLSKIEIWQNIGNIPGNLEIIGNDSISLIDFSDSVLSSIYGNFDISNNKKLQNIGLNSNVNEICGNIIIESNYELLNLQGLGNLKVIGGDLSIYDNFSLFSLCLENCTDVLGDMIIISSNCALSESEINNFINNLNSVPDIVYIH